MHVRHVLEERAGLRWPTNMLRDLDPPYMVYSRSLIMLRSLQCLLPVSLRAVDPPQSTDRRLH